MLQVIYYRLGYRHADVKLPGLSKLQLAEDCVNAFVAVVWSIACASFGKRLSVQHSIVSIARFVSLLSTSLDDHCARTAAAD